VRDLDKAVTFYRALGFAPGPVSDAATNAPLRDIFGLPEAKIRWSIARAPSIAGGIEIVEISGAKATPLKRRPQDPGAFTLLLTVRDLDVVATRLKALGTPVLTTDGMPTQAPIGGRQARRLTIQDPDGHFVELIQPAAIAANSVPAEANVVEAGVRLTVQNLNHALALYRDALGLAPIDRQPFTDERAAAMGSPGARFQTATLQVPQSGLMLELIEFAGRRRSIQGQIQDPGSTRMQLRVRNVDEAIAALAPLGGEVISSGGKPVELPAGNGKITVAIDREPDNLFIVMFGARTAVK
jgi:catechol 2,3-dioxygenase-like lactoylglutathione lyase family enzyme